MGRKYMSTTHDADAKKLAELGYKQEFDRKWSGFNNFAISFSIISILSGCFTTFGQAWNNGGPVAIAIGWPIIAIFVMFVGLSMSELVSAMPTAGGIYYWALKLGKPIHGWITGWLNLLGLIAVTAGVDYGLAFFIQNGGALFNSWFNPASLKQAFLIFAIILLLHVAINVFGAKMIHQFQGVNVWWHVVGVAAIILIFIFVPTHHQTASWVFTHHINNSGFSGGFAKYWFYILPLGFLLSQYTLTGFDASAHVSEETGGASLEAAKGLWRAIAYSGIAGWIMLLAILFSATDEAGITKNGGTMEAVIASVLGMHVWAKTIYIITCVGQFLCGMSCVTAGSRMLFAFARDGAVPGKKFFTKLDKNRNPSNAALGLGIAALIITLPALYAPKGSTTPVAFYAVTSITVIGLFSAFAIPIFLRWRKGDAFVQGEWNLGKNWKWIAPLAVAEVFIVSIYFVLPFSPAGIPFRKGFTWTAVQYAPIVVVVIIGGALIWWFAGAKNRFNAPLKALEI